MTKSIVNNQGICIPLTFRGNDKIKYETYKDETLVFPDFQQIKEYFKLEIS